MDKQDEAQEAPVDYPTGYEWCGNTWAIPDEPAQ
jgi:hypothetical protein